MSRYFGVDLHRNCFTVCTRLENGREYLKLHGGGLHTLPHASTDRPNPGFLQWHNEQVFRG